MTLRVVIRMLDNDKRSNVIINDCNI